MTDTKNPQEPPQNVPKARLTEEAYEDAVELARALRWAAEHANEVTLSRAEIDRQRAA